MSTATLEIQPFASAPSAPHAVSILSPPASPYPDLSSLQQYLKKKQLERAALETSLGVTPVSSAATTPQDESFSDPKGAKMITCWNALLNNPNRYYERERSFLSLYPTHKQTWSNHIYVENPTQSRRRRQWAGRGRRGVQTPLSTETDSDTVISRRAERESSSDGGASDSDGKRSPKRRSPAAVSRVHDLSIAQIEDFSPSCSLLPPGRSLRAEWKGAPMDLSNDPDVHLLHPAEVHLASVLRLPAEIYLDSKRRLFAEKVHRMRQGLAFRRTDSQKACRIDVNKASRLFGAFERVGWLDDELFTKYL